MANKDLKNNTYFLPEEIKGLISNNLSKLEDGKKYHSTKRAEELISDTPITYSNMYRIKNFLDSYLDKEKDGKYKIIGGDRLLSWINSELSSDTEANRRNKETKRDSGLDNQFKDTHTKNKSKVSQNDANSGMIDVKNSFKNKNIMSGNSTYISEGVIKYKNIINYIENQENGKTK